MTPKTMVSTEIYLLPLNDDGSPDVAGGYIYIAPKSRDPVTIRFAIEGTSSICRHGSLWVNIPEEGDQFKRDKFREFKLLPDFNRTIEISIPIEHAGAYAFYTTYDELPDLSSEPRAESLPTPARKQSPIYYVDVAPRLVLDGRPLPLPALSIFSVISKFMGTYPTDWEKHLRGISDRGYNMIHFTPLQVRGASNSPYSLYDQLGWDPDCFPNGESDVEKMVESLEQNHGLLSLTDIVLNHTAHNTKWLEEHPDAGYNLKAAPWLESAYVLDSSLLKLSSQLEEKGLPTELESVDDLMLIMDAIKKDVVTASRMWEYYVMDVKRDAAEIVKVWSSSGAGAGAGLANGAAGTENTLKTATVKELGAYLREHAMLGNDQLGERFRRRIDPQAGSGLLDVVYGPFGGESDDGETTVAAATAKITEILDAVNMPLYEEYDAEVADILQQLFNRTKYMRLDDNGPKAGKICPESPLAEPYFTRLPGHETRPDEYAVANNGWVWGGNAMVDNAGPQSRVYLRREVIVWGDCVKLRYGQSREDSPFLWDHMTEYARMLARHFAGFRIDNCHSTPLHVAEHILDEARRVRPDLYVVAELFTGSEEQDYLFVKRLGLSSLIREAMQAHSTAELSRLVHRHGGRPIGSFELDEVARLDRDQKGGSSGSSGSSPATSPGGAAEGPSSSREIIRRIRPCPVHALFMDCTHDNETPAQKRDARDTLPNAALVSMCASATGSVMGYDEIYPKLVDLVHETRLYTSESSERQVKIGTGRGGIGGIKKLLNQIHSLMGKDGYEETHIHHEDQYITVHRVHPESRKGYYLIAHTAFPGYGNGNGAFSTQQIRGTRVKHLGSWMLEVDDSEEAREAVLGDATHLRGLPSRVLEVPGIRMEVRGDSTYISARDRFPPGSIALFETWNPEHSSGLDSYVTSGAREAFGHLGLADLNFVLYRCDAEERDWSGGADGVYEIPGHGQLVYAGLQGWWSILRDVIRDNNLAHPICDNLRQGQWALDHCVGRLAKASRRDGFGQLERAAVWLKERLDAIRGIPNFLLPRSFALVIRTAYNACWRRGLELMGENVQRGQWFLQSLAMVSIQQTGIVQSASLNPQTVVPCLAAGLPHFAVEWARCWGRDVFISLRGLYLGTGRFAEAREHILAFAAVMKHGMIPNLLGSGKMPRYNARDSIWFFLQCIQDYTRIVPGGMSLLKDTVKRRFLPYDDACFDLDDPRAYSTESTIEEIVQEALQRHATGLRFREANAGPGLDSQMNDEGFNISVQVDWDNGLIFGGNQHNCGTWMDKMGESEKAGSKGVPGTPRDGAAVEIIGLLYSVLRWVERISAAGQLAKDGVTKADGTAVTFKEWADLIQANFERCFFVPLDPDMDASYDVNPRMVNRRGMYKDLYRSGKEYEDYQLRPNFPIAMTVAPDLFTPANALHALCLADSVLRGPTGMATLDPADLNYRPFYRNSEDSDDFATAKGRNYHQGPEWLWPTPFLMRAMLKFDLRRRAPEQEGAGAGAGADEGRTEAFQQVTRRLRGCKEMIRYSPWAGLAELTQKNGEHCADSCPTQAWSAGCLIDLYMDADEEQNKIAKQGLALRQK